MHSLGVDLALVTGKISAGVPIQGRPLLRLDVLLASSLPGMLLDPMKFVRTPDSGTR